MSVGSDAFTPVAELLIGQSNKIGSFGLSINKGKSAAINFQMNPSVGKEAYILKVSSKKIDIQASTGAGAFPFFAGGAANCDEVVPPPPPPAELGWPGAGAGGP